MAHPHRKAAAESSREKFKAITGVRGGGHPFEGASHSKRADGDGEIKSWNGHRKTHLAAGESAHGDKSKARGDRFARGGRTHEHEDTPGGPLGGANARREIEAGNRQSRGTTPAPTGAWAPKELSDDHPASSRKSFLKRGGHAKGGKVKSDLPKDLSEHVNYEGEHWKMRDTTGKHSPEEEKRIQANAKKKQYEGKEAEIGRIDRDDPLFRKMMGKGATDSSGLSEADKRGIVDGNRGGRMRHHRADGGGVSVGGDNPFEGKGKSKSKAGKNAREVTINITAAPPPQPPAPPPMPPAPPAGAAPPPAPMPPPGGAGGPGGGSNPLMSALGKGMGGMARGGRAMGGRTKPDRPGNESLTHNDGLKEWRDRAMHNTQRKANERIGHAAGGRIAEPSRGSLPKAGALSGEGRLEKAEDAKRNRK